MPCAAGELCLGPALTHERYDGHECRGKCGGRLHRDYLSREADPDCDNEVNVDDIEDSGDDTTGRGSGAPPPCVELCRTSFRRRAQRRRAVKRCLLLFAEGQHVIHQSTCL